MYLVTTKRLQEGSKKIGAKLHKDKILSKSKNTYTKHETSITGKKFNQYAQIRPVSDPLNVRLVANIIFSQSKFRTLYSLYNLPAKKKENL